MIPGNSQEDVSFLESVCNLSSEDPRSKAENVEWHIILTNGSTNLRLTQLFRPRLDWILLHIDLADMYLSTIEIISDDEACRNRVHDPVKHTDAIIDDWPKIGVEVNGHHRLIRILTLPLDAEQFTNFALATITSYEVSRCYLMQLSTGSILYCRTNLAFSLSMI